MTVLPAGGAWEDEFWTDELQLPISLFGLNRVAVKAYVRSRREEVRRDLEASRARVAAQEAEVERAEQRIGYLSAETARLETVNAALTHDLAGATDLVRWVAAGAQSDLEPLKLEHAERMEELRRTLTAAQADLARMVRMVTSALGDVAELVRGTPADLSRSEDGNRFVQVASHAPDQESPPQAWVDAWMRRGSVTIALSGGNLKAVDADLHTVGIVDGVAVNGFPPRVVGYRLRRNDLEEQDEDRVAVSVADVVRVSNGRIELRADFRLVAWAALDVDLAQPVVATSARAEVAVPLRPQVSVAVRQGNALSGAAGDAPLAPVVPLRSTSEGQGAPPPWQYADDVDWMKHKGSAANAHETPPTAPRTWAGEEDVEFTERGAPSMAPASEDAEQPVSIVMGPSETLSPIVELIQALERAPGLAIDARAFRDGFYRVEGRMVSRTQLADWLGRQPGVASIRIEGDAVQVTVAQGR